MPEQPTDPAAAALRLNHPMVQRLRGCAADTDPDWAGKITIYPPEARSLVALIDQSAEHNGAWHAAWLHGDWHDLTRHMTTEQREAAALAVERHWEPATGTHNDKSDLTRAALWWWRDTPPPRLGTCWRCDGTQACPRCGSGL